MNDGVLALALIGAVAIPAGILFWVALKGSRDCEPYLHCSRCNAYLVESQLSEADTGALLCRECASGSREDALDSLPSLKTAATELREKLRQPTHSTLLEIPRGDDHVVQLVGTIDPRLRSPKLFLRSTVPGEAASVVMPDIELVYDALHYAMTHASAEASHAPTSSLGDEHASQLLYVAASRPHGRLVYGFFDLDGRSTGTGIELSAKELPDVAEAVDAYVSEAARYLNPPTSRDSDPVADLGPTSRSALPSAVAPPSSQEGRIREATPAHRNGWAFVGLVMGLFSVFLFEIGMVPIGGVIASIVGLARVGDCGGKGKVMGGIGLALSIAYTLAYMVRYGHIG